MALDTIQSRVCQVEVWGAPVGAEILVDGKPSGNLPAMATWLLPGHALLQIRAVGYVEISRSLKIPEGGHVREHVDLRRDPTRVASVGKTESAIRVNDSTSKDLFPRIPTPAVEDVPPPIYRQWWFLAAMATAIVAAGGTVWLLTRYPDDRNSCTTSCSTWAFDPN